MSHLRISPFKRFILKCCTPKTFNLHLFKGRIIEAHDPPEPSNIKWENIQTEGCYKKIRRALSWVFTGVLLLIPMVLIVIISYYQAKENPQKITCPNDDSVTREIALTDYLDGNQMGYMFCYCTTNFKSTIDE